MRYEVARPKIQSGDILAWSGTGPISSLIRFATGSIYSHIGIACWLYDRLWVLEVREFGRTPPTALSARQPFIWIPSEADWNAEVGRTAFRNLDAPYSYIDAVRAAFRLPLGTKNGLICSEFVRDTSVQLGIAGIVPDATYVPGTIVQARLDAGAKLIPVGS